MYILPTPAHLTGRRASAKLHIAPNSVVPRWHAGCTTVATCLETAAMSIGSISGATNWWQNQVAQASASSSAGSMPTASPTSDSIANTGTVAASNVSSFMQAFSADLQAMLTQLGDEANTPTTSPTASTNSATSSCTTASATNPTDPTQSLGEVHHRHHHMHGGGEDQSMDNTANQLVGQIGQSLQGGTLGSGRIRQSASVLAGDVMQALQSYGAMAPGASLPPILA